MINETKGLKPASQNPPSAPSNAFLKAALVTAVVGAILVIIGTLCAIGVQYGYDFGAATQWAGLGMWAGGAVMLLISGILFNLGKSKEPLPPPLAPSYDLSQPREAPKVPLSPQEKGWKAESYFATIDHFCTDLLKGSTVNRQEEAQRDTTRAQYFVDEKLITPEEASLLLDQPVNIPGLEAPHKLSDFAYQIGTARVMESIQAHYQDKYQLEPGTFYLQNQDPLSVNESKDLSLKISAHKQIPNVVTLESEKAFTLSPPGDEHKILFYLTIRTKIDFTQDKAHISWETKETSQYKYKDG